MDDPQSTANVDRQIQSLERKSLSLSRATAVILVSLSTLGLGALLVPDLTVGVELRTAGERAWYSLATLLGFGLLLGLFAFWQQRVWGAARRGLLGEVVRRDALEKLLLIDPLTGAFNRRYLDEVLTREISRAERHGSSLTFLKIQVGNLNEARTRLDCGTREGLLKAAAGVLRRNLRPTDVVVRFDEDHFMVVMSETSKHGALVAVRRLLECADAMNLASAGKPGYPLELSYGLADYRKGIDVRDVLAAADHSVRLYQDGPGKC
ncbi:MAG TPA: diguanylate cyclase [Terriglobia bacterium]|nr:diguanylate cyclase [Terriglobia bacterium]